MYSSRLFSVHIHESESVSCLVVSDSLRPHARLFCPWNSPGKNTAVGCHSLLQEIFLIQELNLGLLHCRQIFLPSEPLGKPIHTPVQANTYVYNQVVLVVKNLPSSAGDLRDVGSIPGLGRSPGGGHAIHILHIYMGFSSGSDAKESACNAGDLGSVPGLERSLGEGNGYPLQYYCLENCMDRGTWWATVYGSHRVDALSDLAHMHAYIYTHTYTYHWGCYFFIRNSKLFIQKPWLSCSSISVDL